MLYCFAGKAKRNPVFKFEKDQLFTVLAALFQIRIAAFVGLINLKGFMSAFA